MVVTNQSSTAKPSMLARFKSGVGKINIGNLFSKKTKKIDATAETDRKMTSTNDTQTDPLPRAKSTTDKMLVSNQKTQLTHDSEEWKTFSTLSGCHYSNQLGTDSVNYLINLIHQQINRKYQFSVDPSNADMLESEKFKITLDEYKLVISNLVGKSISQSLKWAHKNHIVDWIHRINEVTRHNLYRTSKGYDAIFNYGCLGQEAFIFRNEIQHKNKQTWLKILYSL